MRPAATSATSSPTGARSPGGTIRPAVSDYDPYVDELADYTGRREQGGVAGDELLVRQLELLGEVAGRRVLDAACGDGYLARVLAARGAQVTGIDLGPRLIERARERDPGGAIDYRVADLSQPLPGEEGSFDAVASYLALNDVADYRGFIVTLAAALMPGGRLVIAFDSPYGALADVAAHPLAAGPDSILPDAGRFPRFMPLAFSKS